MGGGGCIANFFAGWVTVPFLRTGPFYWLSYILLQLILCLTMTLLFFWRSAVSLSHYRTAWSANCAVERSGRLCVRTSALDRYHGVQIKRAPHSEFVFHIVVSSVQLRWTRKTWPHLYQVSGNFTSALLFAAWLHLTTPCFWWTCH